MSDKQKSFIPIKIEDYYPKVAVRLLNRILAIGHSKKEAFVFRLDNQSVFIMKNKA